MASGSRSIPLVDAAPRRSAVSASTPDPVPTSSTRAIVEREILQHAQAQSRRLVMTRAEAHGRPDDDDHIVCDRITTIPRRRDDDASDAHGTEGRLRAGGPILVRHVYRGNFESRLRVRPVKHS